MGRWKKIGLGFILAAASMVAFSVMLMDEENKAVLRMMVAGTIDRLSTLSRD